MKVAIHHQFLDNIGGAEKVVYTLAKELRADIYTTNKNKQNSKRVGYKGKIKSIGKIPQEPPYRHQLALTKFHFFKTRKKYDTHIIAGEWAVSTARKNKPSLWYVHSPPRELWDLYKHTNKHLLAPWQKPLFFIWAKINKYLFKQYAKKPAKIVCNSQGVQKRIRAYLRREATVIHPPVDTTQYYYKRNGNFWLSVNRLLPHKRINMQIEAFRNIPNERLVIVGSYEKAKHFMNYKKKLQKKLPFNVTLLHHVTDKNLKELYATCKGLIATANNEDFGLTPVEAMASGKPIIAGKEGGYKETIIDGETGVLIENINPEKIIQAVKILGPKAKTFKNACMQQAKKFDTKIFIKKIKKELKDIVYYKPDKRLKKINKKAMHSTQ